MEKSMAMKVANNLIGNDASVRLPSSIKFFKNDRAERSSGDTAVSDVRGSAQVNLQTCWLTVAQVSEKYPVFSQNSLRAHIFNSKSRVGAIKKGECTLLPANGLEIAICRVGRRVLINEQSFLNWVEKQSCTPQQSPNLIG